MAELATICSVPIDYIVMRGQGIKLLSFIAKKCRDAKTLMPVIERSTSDGSYEGAICLKPKRAFYVDDPVAVVDYAALYPSSMISENISHDSKVWTKEYDLSGQLIIETGSGEYDNLAGWEYVDVEYDRYEWRAPPGRKKEEKVKIGTKICRFAQFPDGKKAIMPRILQELLAARKATRAKIKYKTVNRSDGSSVSGTLKELDDKYEITQWDATDGKLSKTKTTVLKTDVVGEVNSTFTAFMKNVFDKRQAGLKVTANSLYGQCGARTSAFYEMDIAASTTATGRKLLLYAQRIIEDVYKDTLCETSYGRVRTRAEYIYGDTDSVFFTFHLEDEQGEKILGKRALEMTIELAQEAGKLASKFLKAPHDLEYEKTFHPFLLLSKKRYVGLLYETDPNKCKRKSMGIVLKRRDNAPIVKDVYGGIIDILMHQKNVAAAVEFTKECLENMVAERYPLEKLIVSKSLRGWYKNPDSIAHRVLADRMGKRDPGNKPSIGSRIPYVYIQTKKKVKLQGNRIETPSYVRANNLKPDYGFYITNQIMKPVQQVFALILEQIPSFRNRKKFHDDVRRLRHRLTEEKAEEAEKKLRNSLVKKLVFEDALRCASNNKAGQRSIMSFFGE
jgi:DNA polymerase elongation subunit (family B)